MLRLTDLTIHRFLDLQPDTVLRFSDSFNFVLGRNGSGKTTLLSLIAAVARHDTLNLAKLAGDQPVHLSAKYVSTRIPERAESLESGTYDIDMELRLESIPGEEALASLGLNIPADADLLRTGFARYLVVRREDGLHCSVTLNSDGSAEADPPAPKPGPRLPFPRLLSTDLFLFTAMALLRSFTEDELQSDTQRGTRLHTRKLLMLYAWSPSMQNISRFDEALATFSGIVSGRVPERDVDPFLPPPARIERHAGSGFSLSFVPESFLGNISPHQWSTTLPPDQSPCSDIARVLGAASVSATARGVDVGPVEAGAIPERAVYEGFDIYVGWRDGSRQMHPRLSFGQKRVVAFSWYISCLPDGIVVADELTNGLHYEYVEDCIALVGSRQGFFALQNPLLLDLLGPGDLETVTRSFVLCALEHHEGKSRHVWRNPTAQEGHRILKSWETSLDKLSSILRQEELW